MKLHFMTSRKLTRITSLYADVKELEGVVRGVLANLESGREVTNAQFEEGIRFAKMLTYDKCGAYAYRFDKEAPEHLKNRLGFDYNETRELCGRLLRGTLPTSLAA